MNTTAIEYRGRILNIDQKLNKKYEFLQRRPLKNTDIDQYLANEADLTGLDPIWGDPEEFLVQFSQKQMEEIINRYLKREIRMRGGKDFELP